MDTSGTPSPAATTEQRDAFVSRELGGRVSPRTGGICAADVIDTTRLAGDTVREYVWAVCHEALADSAAPGSATGAASFPAVLISVGEGATYRLLRGDAPRQATYRADFERLFPPSVRASRDFNDVTYSNARVGTLDRRARARQRTP